MFNKTLLIITCLFLSITQGISNSDIDSISISKIQKDFTKEIGILKLDYQADLIELATSIDKINDKILNNEDISAESFLSLLKKREQLNFKLQKLEAFYNLNITKLRYKKGIDLIRLLYEKILGLDHHFSSLETHQNISKISNPNSYTEFQEINNVIENRLKKKNAIRLPTVLQDNPYISAVFSLFGSFLGDFDTHKKEKDLKQISCILDFTLRINNELNTIYYETEFLKKNNISLQSETLDLFKEYSKVIGYHTPLNICRKEDDWDKVYNQLDEFILQLEQMIEQGGEIGKNHLYKKQISLEFSVDRLLEFINKYTAFIHQGEKYYQKFHIILSNYKNETTCAHQIPPQFHELKDDINNSINKFNEAYNIAEIKGSKLKDLLYGFTE